MDIDANLRAYMGGRNPEHGVSPLAREASFDYCYNYFQSFRETPKGCMALLTLPEHLHQSCLQLGFYLASWGMFRGGADLSQKSVRAFEPAIRCIAEVHPATWSIDVDSYTDANICWLLKCENRIVEVLKDQDISVSTTLVTKILMGVFGIMPAFDTNFVKWLSTRPGMRGELWLGERAKKSLQEIARFYQENKAAIDGVRVPTIDFNTGKPNTRNPTPRFYPKAKIIDMIGFVEGQRM